MMKFSASSAAIAVSVAATLCTTAGIASAAEPTGVLKRIKDNGAITLGYRESSIPFSYLDGNAQPIGYSIDLCRKVADQVRKELAMPDLKVKMQPVTSANRLPLVQNGTIDIECGSTVNNIERQPIVGFSVTTFVVATRFLAKKSDNLRTADDLAGKTIAATTGTNTITRIRALDRSKNLNLKVVTGKDHADSFLQLQSGRAVAFFEDDILLTGIAASSQTPSDFALSTDAFSADPYALVFAKGDEPFKKLVDGVLTSMFRSGEINGVYTKWFTQPIPPRNVSMNFPMGAALKKVIATPTDSPDQAAYQ